jgi:2'-5' RNA ligase
VTAQSKTAAMTEAKTEEMTEGKTFAMTAGTGQGAAPVGVAKIGQDDHARERRVRSFVAVPLPPVIQAGVLAAATGLAVELPDVRWSLVAENLHVTVKFLGQVAAGRLKALADALAAELAPRDVLEVGLRGFGAFPSADDATTIWAGVEDPDGRLGAVALTVERVVQQMGLGVPPERRTFRPHVTVGRCKRGVDARRALDPWRDHIFGTATVAALHVYESRLGAAGSTYVLHGRAPLGTDSER